MISRGICYVLVLLLLFPLSTALSTTLADSYDAKETMVIEVVGQILEPITAEDIVLKRNNVQVPLEYEVRRLGNRWFIWAIAPESQNTYTLYLNDITTTKNGNPVVLDYNQSFNVTNETALYTLRPGVLRAPEQTVSLEAVLNSDFQETISIDFPESREATLNPGTNTLTISIPSGTPVGLQSITIGEYILPLYVETYFGSTSSDEPAEEVIGFVITPQFVESIVLFNEMPVYPLTIINPSPVDITDLTITYDSSVLRVEPSNIGVLKANSSVIVDVSPVLVNGQLQEVITISSSEFTYEIPVRIEYTDNEDEVASSAGELDYCFALGGESCLADEVCSGSVVTSRDYAQCCIGGCVVPEESGGSLGATIGWLLAMIALIIVVIILARYMKSRKPRVKSINAKASELSKK